MSLSYSRISTYLQCPLKYRFQYIDRLEPEVQPAAMIFGRCIHQALAAYHQQILEGRTVDIGEIQQVFALEWEMAHGSDIPIDYGKQENQDSLLEKGKRLVAYFIANYQPVGIIGIEEPFTIALEDGPELSGRLDLLLEDQKGKISLVDLKTSSRRPSERFDERDLQLTLYALALAEMGYPLPIEVKYLVLVKTKTPQLVEVTGLRQAWDLEWIKQLAKGVWGAIQDGHFYPNPNYLCAGCPYKQACRDWQKTKVPGLQPDTLNNFSKNKKSSQEEFYDVYQSIATAN